MAVSHGLTFATQNHPASSDEFVRDATSLRGIVALAFRPRRQNETALAAGENEYAGRFPFAGPGGTDQATTQFLLALKSSTINH